jgi:methylglutaconyl-CoA hydratase
MLVRALPRRLPSLARAYSAAAQQHALLKPASELGLGDAADLDGIQVIVLNRPDARNALSRQMVDELRDYISRLSTSDARVAILHSLGPVFCAGADLRERKGMSQPEVARFLDDLNAMVSELEALPLPTIAAVPGPALGGGTELALGCDLRTGQKETSFALPETKLGIIPGAGGTQRMTHLLGKSKAMELIFTGRRVGVEEALRLGRVFALAVLTPGLIDVLAKDGQSALEAAVDLSKLMLTSAPLSLRAAKQAIKSAPGTPIEQGIKNERAAYNTLLETEDRLEGLRAFAEKRKPVFQGK